MKEYYDILGLPVTATLEEIKNAYRQKAKEYHPDKNKAPEAEQKFIALTEAYKLLTALRTQGFSRILRTSVNKKQAREHFVKKQKAMARTRAREYADLKYEEFIASEGYQTKEAFAVIIYHLLFLICFGLAFIMPLVLALKYGLTGLFSSLGILLILSPFVFSVLGDFQYLSFKNLKESFQFLFKGFVLKSILLSAFNVWVLLRVGFQTLIPTNQLLLAYPLTSLVVFVLFRKKTKDSKIGSNYFRPLCLAPFVINVFLLTNYLFSSDARVEAYFFQQGYQKVYNTHGNGGTQKTTLITLENDRYDLYWGIRVFNNYEMLRTGRSIRYTFKKGLFGIRVVTDYTIR